MLYGGRIAEEQILNQQTTGASNDIERATSLARRMVCNWGMSRLGPINYGQKETEVFLGRDLTQRSEISETMAAEVDKEVRAIVDRNYARAEKLLKKYEKELHILSEALLEYETLDAQQVKDLLAGKPLKIRKVRSRGKENDAKSEGGGAAAQKASSAPAKTTARHVQRPSAKAKSKTKSGTNPGAKS